LPECLPQQHPTVNKQQLVAWLVESGGSRLAGQLGPAVGQRAPFHGPQRGPESGQVRSLADPVLWCLMML